MCVWETGINLWHRSIWFVDKVWPPQAWRWWWTSLWCWAIFPPPETRKDNNNYFSETKCKHYKNVRRRKRLIFWSGFTLHIHTHAGDLPNSVLSISLSREWGWVGDRRQSSSYFLKVSGQVCGSNVTEESDRRYMQTVLITKSVWQF